MKVLSFTNQKGGVGKSTTCFNVGAALGRRGYKVLLIDADPQGDLSTMAGYKELEEDDLQLYDVLHRKADINAAIKTTEELSIVPSDDYLTLAELDMVEEPRTALRKALRRVQGSFDYCLIDCPPSLNVLTLNALTASDAVIIPVMSDYLPLKGVARLRDTIELVRKKLNKALQISGIVLTFYNDRANLDREVRESLENAFGGKVFNTAIPRNKKLAEAPSHGESIFQYSPRSKGAACYMALSEEITQKIQEEQ